MLQTDSRSCRSRVRSALELFGIVIALLWTVGSFTGSPANPWTHAFVGQAHHRLAGAISSKAHVEKASPRVRRSVAESSAESPAELLRARRSSRWEELRDELDWTRYHLQIAVLEHGAGGRSRVAAGLFERVASFHSCAGALPVEAATTGDLARALEDGVAQQLRLNAHWQDREISDIGVEHLGLYDVVVCIDSDARDILQAKLRAVGGETVPPYVVDIGDFGSYLEQRNPESPMKAWVPDWRAEMDPDYDERQSKAEAPLDDALAVWNNVPEDLAQLIQPRYSSVASALATSDDTRGKRGAYGGDDDAAYLGFHMAGLVRFLMDSYPLDLEGGPGYIPM